MIKLFSPHLHECSDLFYTSLNPAEYPHTHHIPTRQPHGTRDATKAKLMFCIAWLAAPLRRLSIVATTTTRFPEDATANPPTATPCFPLMSRTRGASPETVTRSSPAYRSWYKLRISRDVKCFDNGILIECVIPWNLRAISQETGDMGPLSDVWDEGDGTFKVVRDFAFVDMVGQGIRDEIVLEVFDVVFRGRFSSCARVPAHAEYSRRTGDILEQRCDSDLCGRSITSRIRNMRCFT